MENKKKDVLYCGVDDKKIKNASPKLYDENLDLLFYWISERYKIHLKKDLLKESYPFTLDKVLQKYRFCNVRREQDKETRWLIENIVNSGLSFENKIFNIILFRLINKHETIDLFGLLDFGNIDYNYLKKCLENIEKSYVYFSNAFFTSGPKRVANLKFDDESMVVKIVKLVESYSKTDFILSLKDCDNQKEVFDLLRSLDGIGDFLAYQIFVDFSYMDEFDFSENEFVVAGPGCKRGLDLIFRDFDGLNYEEALFWLRDNFGFLSEGKLNVFDLFSDLKVGDRKMNVMSLENCMCELSKYWRALNNKGRPRIRFKV